MGSAKSVPGSAIHFLAPTPGCASIGSSRASSYGSFISRRGAATCPITYVCSPISSGKSPELLARRMSHPAETFESRV